jgi:hypothetical protein
LLALAVAGVMTGLAFGADAPLDSLKKGTPDLKSAGALTFGPQGILFVADTQGAAIFAIDTGDRSAAGGTGRPKVEALDEKIGGMLGVEAKQVRINDLAVNPLSGNTYLSVARGTGPSAMPVLVKVDRTGKVSEFSLKDVPFAKVTIPNANTTEKGRQEAITDMAFVKDRLFVAGLSSEEFASNLRAIPFPFKDADKGTSVEIFHAGHNAVETRAPVRTFVPYEFKGQTNILAAYTCTPLVKFPVSDLKPGQKVRGTTVAELGQGNRPLDMIVYTKGGKDFLLLANNARGVMKIPTEGLDTIAPVTQGVKGTAGQKYETIAGLKGVEHLDRFDTDHALILVNTGKGFTLDTIDLP